MVKRIRNSPIGVVYNDGKVGGLSVNGKSIPNGFRTSPLKIATLGDSTANFGSWGH